MLARITLLALALAVGTITQLPAQGQSPAFGVPGQTGAPLSAIDSGQLPAARDNTAHSSISYREGMFMDVDIVGNYAYVAENQGFQIWDVSVPTSPSRLAYLQLKNNDFPVGVPSGAHNSIPIVAVAASSNGNTCVLTGTGNIGTIILDTSNKSSPSVLYQDYNHSTRRVYTANIGGNEYGFVAVQSQHSAAASLFTIGVRAYDLTAAAALSTTVSTEATSPDGVFIGYVGTQTSGSQPGYLPYDDVHGVDDFVVLSRYQKGIEIYDVSNPAAPVAKHGSTIPLVNDVTFGTVMWKDGTTYYLAVATNIGSGQIRLRIYNVTTLLAGTSSSLGSPVYSGQYAAAVSSGLPLTLTRSSNGTPFLYIGSNYNGLWSTLPGQIDYLLNVSNPANPVEVGSAQYWGWYYNYAWVVPKRVAFQGDYVFRAAFGIFDAHEWTGGSSGGSLDITTTSLPSATQGAAYSASIQASANNAPGPYQWTLGSGAPQGLTLSASTSLQATLTGTPTVAASYTFDVTISNGSVSDTQSYTVTVQQPAGLSISTASLPNGSVGVAYSATIDAVLTGSTQSVPYTWTLGTGAPPGLSLGGSTSLQETLVGTPTTAGTYSFDVMITDGSKSATRNYTIDVTAAGVLTISTTSLPSGTEGTLYSGVITAVGGSGPYSWSVVGGNVPPGLSLAPSTTASTTLGGTPTTSGVYSFDVQIDDSTTSATGTISLIVQPSVGGGGSGFGGGGGGGGGGCASGHGGLLWLPLLLFPVLLLIATRKRIEV